MRSLPDKHILQRPSSVSSTTWALFFFLASSLLSASILAQNLEEILAQHVEAMGGEDALASIERIKSLQEVTSATSSWEQEGEFWWKQRLGYGQRKDERLQYVICFEGNHGWLYYGTDLFDYQWDSLIGKRFPTAVWSQVHIQNMAPAFTLTFVVNRDSIKNLQLLTEEFTENKSTFPIEVVYENGIIEILYLDRDTHLINKVVRRSRKNRHTVETTRSFADYRSDSGVYFPATEHVDLGTKQDIKNNFTYTTISFDDFREQFHKRCKSPIDDHIRREILEKNDRRLRIVSPMKSWIPPRQVLDPKLKVGLYFDQEHSLDAEILDLSESKPQLTFIQFKDSWIKSVTEGVRALFPQTEVIGKPYSRDHQLVVTAGYTGGLAYDIDMQGRYLLKSFDFVSFFHLTDVNGDHVDVFRSTQVETHQGRLPGRTRLRELATTAMQESLNDNLHRLSVSKRLRAQLATLQEHREKPPSLRLVDVRFDDKGGIFPNAALDAGEQTFVEIEIINDGPGRAFHLEAIAAATDASEITTSKSTGRDLAPGQTGVLKVPVSADLDLSDGLLSLSIRIDEKHGFGLLPFILEVETRELLHPKLEIVDVALDDDGDGLPASGEKLNAVVRVRNAGVGKASGVRLTATSTSAIDELDLEESEIVLPTLRPGESEAARFPLTISRTAAAKTLDLSFTAVDLRGAVLAQTETTRSWTMQTRRPDLQIAHELFDGGSAASSGNRDGVVNNTERVETTLKLHNLGDLEARDVRVDVVVDPPSIQVSPAQIEFKDLPSESRAPERSLILDVPRDFGVTTPVDDIRLRLSIEQADFSTTQQEIVLDFEALASDLSLQTSLPERITAGTTTMANLRLQNRGTLAAEGLEMLVSSSDPCLLLLDSTGVGRETLRIRFEDLAPNADQQQSIRIRARNDLADGEAALRISVSEEDFSGISQRSFTLRTATPNPAVIPAPAPAPEPIVRTAAPTTIFFRDFENDERVASESVVLAFNVLHLSPLVDLRLTQGEREIPITSASGDDGVTLVRREVKLVPGKNIFRAVAVTQEGTTTEQVLTLIHEAATSRFWVVAVGIDQYRDPAIEQDLNYAATDARAVYRHYRDLGIPEENAVLLIDEQADLRSIRSLLGTKLRQTKKQDTVVIYLAGHGFREQDPTGSHADGLNKYFLPADAEMDDLFTTALEMGDLATILRRIPAGRVVVMIDSCFSGAAGGRSPYDPGGLRALLDDQFLEILAQSGEGRVILTASGPNETARESPKFGHGVFTWFLLKALRGAADLNDDGEIDVDETYSYVHAEVRKKSKKSQNPERKAPSQKGRIIVSWTDQASLQFQK